MPQFKTEKLVDIKTKLHQAIETLSVEDIVKSGEIPQIVQTIGKESQGNSQSVTIALYFDFRTFINTKIGDNSCNYQVINNESIEEQKNYIGK